MVLKNYFKQIILSHLVAGFSEQQGTLFSFGPKTHEDTGTLLKISSVTDKTK